MRFCGLSSEAVRIDELATQRAVVQLVLERERELAALERLLGPEALAAVKTLAADGVVIRHGERVWASPAIYRVDVMGLIAV